MGAEHLSRQILVGVPGRVGVDQGVELAAVEQEECGPMRQPDHDHDGPRDAETAALRDHVLQRVDDRHGDGTIAGARFTDQP